MSAVPPSRTLGLTHRLAVAGADAYPTAEAFLDDLPAVRAEMARTAAAETDPDLRRELVACAAEFARLTVRLSCDACGCSWESTATVRGDAVECPEAQVCPACGASPRGCEHGNAAALADAIEKGL